jgi:membrane protein implicated in regulation of membrane protease activity
MFFWGNRGGNRKGNVMGIDSFRAFFEPQYLWLLGGVLLMILEFALPGFVVFFFGAGAIIVGVICWVWAISFNWQLVIFIVSSLVMLVTLRKWVKGIFVGYTSSQQAMGELSKEFIGQRVTVVRAIEPGRVGKVEFRGSEWDAESEESLAVGDGAEIVGQESIRLMVRKVRS